MRQLIRGFCIFALVFSTAAKGATWQEKWNDQAAWDRIIEDVVSFFYVHAWEPKLGSYASDIGREGNHLSESRHVVALSRMIYGNIKGAKDQRNRKLARLTANFLLEHFKTKDELGVWYRSEVDAKGRAPADGRKYCFIFEQAYPLAGLTALYADDPVANADLLPVLREAATSFWKRFYDPKSGGLFYYYNFAKRDHTNGDGQTHKSYQSTIYPISSFLFSLSQADPEKRNTYDGWIKQLLDIALTKIVERRDGRITGWLIERFEEDFTVDETYKMSEAGHITQLAWVLAVAVDRKIIPDAELVVAKELLSQFLAHGGFGPKGAVYDAFDRTTGKPLRDDKMKATSAWWSNMEAIIAFAFAKKYRWYADDANKNIETRLDELMKAYTEFFVDKVHGGEYFRIDAETGEVVDSTKGNAGKSAYHTVETYDFLFGKYALAK